MAANLIEVDVRFGFCPSCGHKMRYRTDDDAEPHLARGQDPGEHGCEPDHWYCETCDKWVGHPTTVVNTETW